MEIRPVTEDGIRAAKAWSQWMLGYPSHASDLLSLAMAEDPMAELRDRLSRLGDSSGAAMGDDDAALLADQLVAEANR